MAIIGGGITGLTAAYTFERETNFDVCLIDDANHFGGKIQTVRQDDFILEQGPDSIFTGKPAALELIEELGLDDQVVEPAANGFHLLLDSGLHPVPPGLAGLIGVSPSLINQAGFLSEEGKRRAALESSVQAGNGEDESISSFFTRRFGEEFCRLVAEPILAGTHSGDPAKLSMLALYPKYISRELENGSLSARSASGEATARGPMFLSFKNGMGTIVDSLEGALKRTQFGIAERVMRFEQTQEGTKIWTDDGQLFVDYVFLAVPSDKAAFLLRDLPDTATLLSKIRFASSAIVTAAYPRKSVTRELCGTGFLTPFNKDELLTGCTWTSSKWPHRSPEEVFLVRFFFGGDRRPRIEGISDSELIEKARSCAASVLGINADPDFEQISKWHEGLPQYELGHTELVDRIEQSLEGSPFSVAGCSYRGVGIPDCIRQGRDAARKIAEALG